MENQEEMLSRVRLMSLGDQTWDLSDNDCAALSFVLAERDTLRAQLAAATERAEKAEAKLANPSGIGMTMREYFGPVKDDNANYQRLREAAGKAVEALKAAQVPILRKICADDDSVARPCGIGTDRQWMRLEDALARTPSQHRKEIEAGALREAKDSLKELIQAGAGALTVGRNAGIADAIIHLAKMEKEADRLAKEAGNG